MTAIFTLNSPLLYPCNLSECLKSDMSICESFHVVVVAVAKVYRVYFGVKEESAVKWVEYG